MRKLSSKSSPNEWLRVGQITGAFGIKGQVKVLPLTDFGERLDKGVRLRLRDEWVTVESASPQKSQLILKLTGIENRNEAEAAQWAFLEAPAGQRPELEKDEYFTQDLIGLAAETPEGELLGRVDDVQWAPAHDLLVIGGILVPAVKAFVKKVDVAGGKIVIQLIDGMR